MSTIRTATYLATREHIRVDRKTRGTVKCTAGNKKCGARCIPRDWDCRLKGEGADSHLKAAGKGSDPLTAVANIQRGLGRIVGGITKLNASEIEGGRRAIIRGAVKGSPGDLKNKEELKTAMVQGTIALGALSVVAIGGARAHGILMNTGVYRNNVGQKLEDGAQRALGSVLDNTPLIGGYRSRVRDQGEAAIRRAARGASFTPDRNTLLRNAEVSPEGVKPLLKALRLKPGKDEVFTDWHKRSMKAYYGAKSKTSQHYYFSEDSADNFLRDFYKAPEGIPTRDVARIAIKADARRLQMLADQMGIDRNLPTARRAFVDKYAQSRPGQVRDDFYKMLDPGFVLDQKVDTHFSEIRRRTVATYDKFYEKVNKQFRPFYKPNGERGGNIATRDSLTDVLTTAHATHLAQQFYGNSTIVRGPFTADLVNHHFFATQGERKLRGVVKPWDAPEGVIKRAAREISGGTKLPTMQEAIPIIEAKFPGYRPQGVYGPVVPKAAVVVATRAAAEDRITRGLPKAPKGLHFTWAEENIDEFQKLFTRHRRAAYRMLKLRGGNPSDQEVTDLAYRLLYTTGWLSKGPSGDGWPGGNFDSAPRSDAYQRAFLEATHNLRTDKKCGESGIAPGKKCSKRTNNSTLPTASEKKAGKQEEKSNTGRNIGIGAAVAGAAVAASVLGVKRAQIISYRKGVVKSALVAENMAKQMEFDMKLKAAARLGKPVEKVTGLEASVYDFKDRGRDTGFASTDNSSAMFGQTKNSRGAVVVLSYADDNIHTTRGQGSFNMVKGGTFNKIWGEHDLLPFANNISQPKGSQSLDPIDKKRVGNVATAVKNTVSKIPGITKAADDIANSTTAVAETPALWKSFKFLRDNVETRGFNPDAVRAAAFVAAQRRLTGKPVNIFSYSNGGNVAVETLKILEEMGYRDIKVVNVAGPTFGMFNHSRENLRTWASKKDKFHSMTAGRAFAGGNTKMLDNENIPHGLEEAINPNNKDFTDHKAQRKAGNSYMLDEQLQREAYRFLTVDSLRARQLKDEFVYKAAENLEFDGDLGAVLGGKSAEVKAKFFKTMKTKGREQAKDELLDTIEEGMIDTWYGGYNPNKVKATQKKLRKEFEDSLTPEPAAPNKPQATRSEATAIAALLRMKNPDGSPKYATQQAAKAAYDRMKARRSSKSAA